MASIESVFDGGSEVAATVDECLVPESDCDDTLFGRNVLHLGRTGVVEMDR